MDINRFFLERNGRAYLEFVREDVFLGTLDFLLYFFKISRFFCKFVFTT